MKLFSKTSEALGTTIETTATVFNTGIKSIGNTAIGTLHLANVAVDIGAVEAEGVRISQEMNQAKELGITQNQLEWKRHRMYPERYPKPSKKEK